MAEGSISKFFADRGFGFIKQDNGGKDLFFHADNVHGLSPQELVPGMRVYYESEDSQRGPRAKVVRPIGNVLTTARPQIQLSTKYRFLNPYNFVRPLPEPKTGSLLLGRCAPPPHDRYLGLTGRITCELETITPLFIADAEGARIEQVQIPHKHDPGSDTKNHLHLDFYRLPDPQHLNDPDQWKPALPATSLRGMVRSVFETVTNSCFAVFAGQRLSYRLDAARAAELVPGRIEKNDQGKWVLHLLTGLEPLSLGTRPAHPYAASVHLYTPIRGKLIQAQKVDINGFKHGDECWARIFQKGIFCSVIEIGKNQREIQRPNGPDEHVVQGWLCINNQNIENKRKERFFFRTNDNLTGPEYIELSAPVCQAYRDLIKDYQDRHEDERDKRGESVSVVMGKGPNASPALSRYIYEAEDLKLKEGTLVYAGLSRKGGSPEVLYIAPAAVPRVSYDHTIAELLPYRDRQAPEKRYHRPCDDIEALCPACRTFGWTYQAGEDEKIDLDKSVAYAGRVRFSNATLIDDRAGTLPEVTLAILSTPKPTTTRFYLRPLKGKPQAGLNDDIAGYDGPNRLRGRKFYRPHRVARPEEYLRHRDAGSHGKDDQNRTLHNVRQPGNRFRFTVDFENLSSVELGALLWSLELREGERQGYHRLGMAKPLGFGSVKIEIAALELLNMEIRYQALENDGCTPDAMATKTQWVDAFRRAMEDAYEVPRSHFAKLINVNDLFALLGEPPDLPIHYPRTSREPSAEGKNFEWFMGNNRGGRKNPGPKLSLPLAPDDDQGLPLLDKYGQEVQ